MFYREEHKKSYSIFAHLQTYAIPGNRKRVFVWVNVNDNNQWVLNEVRCGNFIFFFLLSKTTTDIKIEMERVSSKQAGGFWVKERKVQKLRQTTTESLS